jgi:hypothetical protein
VRIDGACDREDARRVGGVEDVQARVPGRVPEGAAQDLGSERGAAHTEQHHIGEARRAHLRDERLDLAQLLEHPLGDRQPSEAVGDLGRALRRPQRRVSLEQSLRDTLLAGERELALHLPA